MKRKKLEKQVSGNGNQRSFKDVISNKFYGFTLIRSKALFYSYFLKAARFCVSTSFNHSRFIGMSQVDWSFFLTHSFSVLRMTSLKIFFKNFNKLGKDIQCQRTSIPIWIPKGSRILNLFQPYYNFEGNDSVYKIFGCSSFPLCLRDVLEHLACWNCKLFEFRN